MDYAGANANSLYKYQWDYIHNPQKMIGLLQDDEEGAAHVDLVDDLSLGNYAGHEDILMFMLGDGLEDLLYEVEVYQYFKDEQGLGGENSMKILEKLNDANNIIKNLLGNIIIADEIEAVYLLEEFNHIYSYRLVSYSHDELMELLYSEKENVFPKNEVAELLRKTLDYASPSAATINNFIDFYEDLWPTIKGMDKIKIGDFRNELLTSLNTDFPRIDFTNQGLKTALSKMSNTQLKKLYKSKFSKISNKQLIKTMDLRRAGIHNYDDLIKVLNKSDKLKIVNTLDDLTLASIRTSTNFKGTTIGKAIPVVGNAINMLQLINYMKNDFNISPTDVLSFVPHPICIYAILANRIVNDEIAKINSSFYELAPTWDMVLNWRSDFKGKPGIIDEHLYICYTDQKEKFNSQIIPTSIIFKNKKDAIRILKFEPTIADFDIKSKMVKQSGIPYFQPNKQVPIEWQRQTQIGLPTISY
jgi:hypothetical protein